MKTIEIPYAVNTDTWNTGLAFYNGDHQKIFFDMIIRNNHGKEISNNSYELNAYSQLAFVPDVEGGFSCLITGPERLSVVAILDKGRGGCMALPVNEIPSTAKN